MKEQRARLIERIKRTADVESFRFTLPDKMIFLPGQFCEIIFEEADRKNRELNKYLSLSASPTKDYIEVTKKISGSEFSRRLSSLKVNDEIMINAPLGNCVYKDEYKAIGFLIGGIGITPVISIIEYIVEKKLPTDVYLFYSNRTEEDIAFRKELDGWQAVDKNIKVYYTVTECQPRDAKCLFGVINKDLVRQKACGITKRTWFIYGPPRMVEAMCAMALELDCPKENIKTENFVGY